MRGLTAALAAAALAIPIVAEAASYGEELKVNNGKELVGKWCASCHATAPRANDAAPSFAVIARQRSPDQIRAFLTKPHGKMPPLDLSNEQIDDIARYIDTLK